MFFKILNYITLDKIKYFTNIIIIICKKNNNYWLSRMKFTKIYNVIQKHNILT